MSTVLKFKTSGVDVEINYDEFSNSFYASSVVASLMHYENVAKLKKDIAEKIEKELADTPKSFKSLAYKLTKQSINRIDYEQWEFDEKLFELFIKNFVRKNPDLFN